MYLLNNHIELMHSWGGCACTMSCNIHWCQYASCNGVSMHHALVSQWACRAPAHANVQRAICVLYGSGKSYIVQRKNSGNIKFLHRFLTGASHPLVPVPPPPPLPPSLPSSPLPPPPLLPPVSWLLCAKAEYIIHKSVHTLLEWKFTYFSYHEHHLSLIHLILPIMTII